MLAKTRFSSALFTLWLISKSESAQWIVIRTVINSNFYTEFPSWHSLPHEPGFELALHIAVQNLGIRSLTVVWSQFCNRVQGHSCVLVGTCSLLQMISEISFLVHNLFQVTCVVHTCTVCTPSNLVAWISSDELSVHVRCKEWTVFIYWIYSSWNLSFSTYADSLLLFCDFRKK